MTALRDVASVQQRPALIENPDAAARTVLDFTVTNNGSGVRTADNQTVALAGYDAVENLRLSR